MRSFLLGQKTEVQSWTNPYVTDGLVAYWDGEWNAGGGKHDASAVKWKDLVGDIDLDDIVINNATWEWTANGFKQTSGIGCRFRRVGTTLTYAHAEICLDIHINDAVSWFGCGNSNGFANYFQYFTATQPSTPIPYVNVDEGAKSISYNDVDKKFWVNGDSYSKRTISAGNYKADGEVYIGNARTGGNAITRYNVVHCVRVYSRALTESEIAHNYAIDARRFGL